MKKRKLPENQFIFNNTGGIMNNQIKTVIDKEPDNLQEYSGLKNTDMRCPFCFTKDKINNYLVADKKNGYKKGTVKCPKCKKGMRRNTLNIVQCLSLKKYAEWIQNYIEMDWKSRDKFDWTNLKNELVKSHASAEFWDGWYAVKHLKEIANNPDPDAENFTTDYNEYLKSYEEHEND